MDSQTTQIKKPFSCDKCNISFRFNSQYLKHCESFLHQTGQKKIRSDKKDIRKCPHCDLYTTTQPTNLKLHILNNHKNLEEKKTEFPFFCDLCNSGFFLNSIFLKHQGTKKHLSREKLSNINNDKIN